MSWTEDLVTGLAEDLDAQSIGTWDQGGFTGNVFDTSIPDSPDDAIGITPYSLAPDHDLADVVQPVQFWLRGSQQFVTATADALFDRYEGVTGMVFAGIHCPLIVLNSDARMGMDANGRYERAVNYYFSAMRPTASRPD